MKLWNSFYSHIDNQKHFLLNVVGFKERIKIKKGIKAGGSKKKLTSTAFWLANDIGCEPQNIDDIPRKKIEVQAEKA